MQCPSCAAVESRVVDTSPDPAGQEIRRRRECRQCGTRYTTIERIRARMPLIVKHMQDGLPARREPFNPDKLRHGIQVACAKRPIPAAHINRLVESIEAELEEMTRSEVSSRVIGEMVIDALREMDEIAYIRYAIVFLGLDDLSAVRQEIDRLLAERVSEREQV